MIGLMLAGVAICWYAKPVLGFAAAICVYFYLLSSRGGPTGHA